MWRDTTPVAVGYAGPPESRLKVPKKRKSKDPVLRVEQEAQPVVEDADRSCHQAAFHDPRGRIHLYPAGAAQAVQQTVGQGVSLRAGPKALTVSRKRQAVVRGGVGLDEIRLAPDVDFKLPGRSKLPVEMLHGHYQRRGPAGQIVALVVEWDPYPRLAGHAPRY